MQESSRTKHGTSDHPGVGEGSGWQAYPDDSFAKGMGLLGRLWSGGIRVKGRWNGGTLVSRGKCLRRKYD